MVHSVLKLYIFTENILLDSSNIYDTITFIEYRNFIIFLHVMYTLLGSCVGITIRSTLYISNTIKHHIEISKYIYKFSFNF